MNSIPSVNMTGNNVNFGHKVKYSPEAQAEFKRQMDNFLKFSTQGPDFEMNIKDFFTSMAIRNYFVNIYSNLGKIPKWFTSIIMK